MWNTPEGDRTSRGAEARMLKAAITDLAELIKEESGGGEDQWEHGIPLFDELSWSQRLVLLEQIATYLLTDTPDTLEPAAVHEAAVGTLFAHMLAEIEHEIESTDLSATRWRELVLAAYQESFPEDADEVMDDEDDFALPAANGDDWEQWIELLETLTDRILWDRDYALEYEMLDVPPEEGDALKESFGITPDYFATAAPDMRGDDLVEHVYRRIKELAQKDGDGS